MSLHIPLPTVPAKARVPEHVAAPQSAGTQPGDRGSLDGPYFRSNLPELRATLETAGSAALGVDYVCQAPFDPAEVPAETLPLWTALRDVLDPELPISVVDMGLIYDLRRDGSAVLVTLTYTATGCPCVFFIRTDITERLLAEPDVDSVELREVWDPPWTRAMMTEHGRAELRKLGVAA
ncbi:MAG: metal-sulfur cluster assembly factor [Gemmatimonadota bacterium]